MKDSGELKEILKGIKGFRDYYPEDFAEINTILDIMRNVSERFGYEEYEGPSLEYQKLIEIKSGQDILEETFTVIGKDKRKLVLRPEQTPTLARMIVNQHQRYSKPIRWYSIPRIFRNETPQKGRVREFFQFNADIIGVDHPAADAEIIALTTAIIKKAGLKDGEFICEINSRELVQGFLEHVNVSNYLDVIKVMDSQEKYLQEYIEKDLVKKGLSQTKAKEVSSEIRLIWQQDPNLTKSDYSKLLDDKLYSPYLHDLSLISKKIFVETLKNKGLSDKQAEKIYTFSQIRDSPEDFIKNMKNIDLGEKALNAVEKLDKLSFYLSNLGVGKNCEYNASIARGLDYYTGIVFEFVDRTGSVVRAIAGGGRYDQLVSTFGGERIPATGIGMGETVLLAILKDLGRMKPYRQNIHVCVAPISRDIEAKATDIAIMLREHFNTLFNPFEWKLANQLEDAANRGVPLVVIVGKRDIEKGQVTLKDLRTGEQTLIEISELISEIQKRVNTVNE